MGVTRTPIPDRNPNLDSYKDLTFFLEAPKPADFGKHQCLQKF
jgi:hypothetical protein